MVDLGTIRGRVQIDIRRAVAAYAALRAQNARTVYALRGTGDAMIATGRTMTIAGAGMVYAFGKTVMAAAEFERKMDYAAAVSDTTGRKMQQLSDYALQLGQDTIYSAGQVAEGFIELAKAGVSAEDIINGIGKAMTDLGAAGDIPLAQSGQIITSTVQQFDLAAQDAVKVTDLLAGAANASIADISDIGVSLKYVGGVANAAGLTFEDTATAISILAKAGIRGSTAGTSLRQMIVSLGGATGPATEALTELGIITADGSNKFFDAEGNVKSLSQVFQILQDQTADLTNKQRLMYLRTIFNNRALSAAAILTRDGAKGFREMNKEMSKVTAADVAAQRLDNLSGDIEILRGNIETLMIEQGGPFQETMREWVQDLTALVQAFNDLDPAVQKGIVQTIGVGGAALIAMGAFNILVGVVLKFIAHMLKLGAGLKFISNMMKILGVNSKWAARLILGPLITALAGVSGIVLVIVAAVLAFLAVWYTAYKNIEPFRKAVNAWYGAIWEAVKAIGAFLKLLATDPSAAWDKTKKAAQIAFEYIIEWAKKVPGLIGRGLSAAGNVTLDFVNSIVGWLSQLPGRALGVILNFVNLVTELLTFRNVGYAIGFMVGTALRLFYELRVKLISLALQTVTGIARFFASLAPRVGYLLGFLLGKSVALMLKLNKQLTSLAARTVVGMIRFLGRLPGRVISLFTRVLNGAIRIMINFAKNIPQYAADGVTGSINFIGKLPGRVQSLFARMLSLAVRVMTRFVDHAVNASYGIYNGLMQGIQNLPSAVSGLLGRVIDAFLAVIRSGYEAAKSFAAGLWQGFKDGIGMNSPSHLERAMWQITGVLDEETKKIAKRTMEVQRLSKKMAATQFSVGGTVGPTVGSSGYASLASMQSRNQNRARTIADAHGRRSAIRHGGDGRKGAESRLVRGELDISPRGRVFLSGVAQDVYDDNEDYDDSIERMDY